MKLKSNTIVNWVLRIGIFGTFLGHGLMAIKTNLVWFPYLTTIGFTAEQIKVVMPIIGVLDILVAFWVLIKPNRYILIWAIVWTFSTALIRPISGETILAFVERGANWAAPLSLYFLLFYKKAS